MGRIVSQVSTSPETAPVLDDDMVKLQQHTVSTLYAPTSSHLSNSGFASPIVVGATGTHSTTTTPLKGGSIHNNTFPPSPPANGLCREWCDVLGEDICPINTHTKVTATKPAPTPISFPGQANYLGSGGSTTHNSSALTSLGSTLLSRNSPSSFHNRYSPYEEKHIRGHTDVAGAVGLQNLGNTCFMNSILQCVSNTEILTKLFQSDDYKSQLNHDNPLGHGGKLAKAYAKLIQDMWCGAYSKVIPREFKTTIGEFQPQFAGYDQQDSQEFLGFLLDGLHVSMMFGVFDVFFCLCFCVLLDLWVLVKLFSNHLSVGVILEASYVYTHYILLYLQLITCISHDLYFSYSHHPLLFFQLAGGSQPRGEKAPRVQNRIQGPAGLYHR